MAALWAHLSKRLIGGGGASTAAAPPPPPRLLHRLGATARSHHHALYEAKVGIPEFLKGVGKGVEAHVAKLEAEIGDIQKLLVARTLRLKKLGIPCKHIATRYDLDSASTVSNFMATFLWRRGKFIYLEDWKAT